MEGKMKKSTICITTALVMCIAAATFTVSSTDAFGHERFNRIGTYNSQNQVFVCPNGNTVCSYEGVCLNDGTCVDLNGSYHNENCVNLNDGYHSENCVNLNGVYHSENCTNWNSYYHKETCIINDYSDSTYRGRHHDEVWNGRHGINQHHH